MKTLKNVAIFLAGVVTYGYLFSVSAVEQAKYPREGTVVLDNDNMRVIRLNPEKGKNTNLAVIVYKDN